MSTLATRLPEHENEINGKAGQIRNSAQNFIWAHREGDLEVSETAARILISAATRYLEFIETTKGGNHTKPIHDQENER